MGQGADICTHLCSGMVAKWRAGEDETGHRYVIAAPIDL